MAASWLVFWVIVARFFEDVPRSAPHRPIPLQPMVNSASAEPTPATSERSLVRESAPTVPQHFHMSRTQWGVAATMSWWAMCSFFLLGSWESMIPVFTSSNSPANPFNFSPFAAGNMIALGGACTIPFLLLNLHYGRRMQDRNTLAIGSAIGMIGLLIAISIISTQNVNYGSFFVAWFLVALGFNITSTVTIALLSKQMPSECEPMLCIRSHADAREWTHQPVHPVEQLYRPCYWSRMGRSRRQGRHVSLRRFAACVCLSGGDLVQHPLAELESQDGLRHVDRHSRSVPQDYCSAYDTW